MNYIPHNDADVSALLAAAGVSQIDELFTDIEPSLRRPTDEKIPDGLTEPELTEHIQRLAGLNRLPALEFLGGGAYRHFIPATVDAVLSRSEFYTSYTPYQPEISQGNLQAIWEFQSMIASLLGMDVTNASLYDGATAAAEAMLMCVRATGRREILVSRGLNPRFRAVIATYAAAGDIALREIELQNGATSYALCSQLVTEKTAGVLLQSPNHFGIIEDCTAAVKTAHACGALVVGTFSEPLAFGMLKSPGAFSCDIAAGEGQSLGANVSFGGPGLGLIACREALLRRLPGRIVGRTVDADGRPGFVLTLQAREQHIRREQATSNICSNHALMALAASVYFATLGRNGFAAVAGLNYRKAHYARTRLLEGSHGRTAKAKDPFGDQPFFNEFVIRLPHAQKVLDRLAQEGIIAGLLLEPDYPELRDCVLVTVTELHKKSDIDTFAGALA